MWLRTQQFQGSETGQLKALTGLDQWQVYFFQGNAWANCQSSGDVVAASGVQQRQVLPSGVRLVLAFAPGSGLNGSLVRDIAARPMNSNEKRFRRNRPLPLGGRGAKRGGSSPVRRSRREQSAAPLCSRR